MVKLLWHVELYEQGNFELISVDSALVFKDMDIGTAKPTKDELLQYPHHLIDIIHPLEVYSAANFVEDACGLIDDMHARGKTPNLVGGNHALFQGTFRRSFKQFTQRRLCCSC